MTSSRSNYRRQRQALCFGGDASTTHLYVKWVGGAADPSKGGRAFERWLDRARWRTITRVPMGLRRWAIAEGWIPSYGNGPEPEFTSHETACILNVGDEDAHVRITLFFTDREPVGPYRVTVPARRTTHLRFNNLTDPAPVPRETDYASIFESDVPVIVQHTRLDSRQAANALITTIAFGTSE